MSRIVFLGTAGDSSVTAKQIRASGGIIIQMGELQLHIDPGPGSLVKAKEFGINPRATSVILVSHNHLNHANDINAVIDAMTLGGFDKKGVLIASSSVINNSEKSSPSLSKFHSSCLERILVLQPEQKAAIEDIEIHAVQASHSDQSALAFKILAPSFTLGYTGDTAFTKELAFGLEGSTILVINTTYPDNHKTDVHMNREAAAKLIGKVKPKLAIITHFGFDMIKADPLLEARSIQLATGVQTIAAHDGLSISPAAYDAHSSQARLTGFK